MSKWISVKDRLPPSGEVVLVSGGIGFYLKEDDVWISMTGEDAFRKFEYKITHWMPLPKLHEGE